MSNILFIKSGSRLNVSNNCIVVEVEDIRESISIYEISAVVIENLQCSITASVNVLCNTKNIPIIYCDAKYNPIAISNSFNTYHRQFFRLQEQIDWTESKKKKLFKLIIIQKIENQLELLKYLKKDIDVIQSIENKLKDINTDNCVSIEALVAKLYFNELFGSGFVRFRDDEINTSLNYGYAILRSIIKQMIVGKGLVPPLGLCHKSQFNNYNLADDVIEVFRPMVDYVTYHFLIKDDNFTKEERCYLQNVVFQKVSYNTSKFEFRECLSMYLDQIVKYMNRGIKKIILPVTRSDLYEY